MKPRGIWIAIGVILVTGIGSTRYVRAYTSGLFQNQAVETAAEGLEVLAETEQVLSEENQLVEKQPDMAVTAEEALRQEKSFPEINQEAGSGMKTNKAMSDAGKKLETSAGIEGGKAAIKEDRTGKKEEDTLAEETLEESLENAQTVEDTSEMKDTDEAAKAPGPIAQIRTFSYGGEILEEDASDRQEKNKSSLERLEELDRQMEKRRAAGQDSSANSAKSVAETERKLWENQLNQLVDILKKELTSSEWDDFMKDQNEWIRSREIMALDALSGNSSPAVQELEYTRSLAELTRDRAYELAKEYSEVLKEAE